MSATYRLTVLTPASVLLSLKDVTKARLRLADGGLISIYPHHAPLIAETEDGLLEWDAAAESGEIDLAAGILQIEPGLITVLTSGLRRNRAEAQPSVEGGDLRFDRLARQLVGTLAGQNVLSGDETSSGEA